MLGIILAVIASNWVGEAIHSDGIYETQLEAEGSVIFLRPSPPLALVSRTAADIAAKPVLCAHCSLLAYSFLKAPALARNVCLSPDPFH